MWWEGEVKQRQVTPICVVLRLQGLGLSRPPAPSLSRKWEASPGCQDEVFLQDQLKGQDSAVLES